MVFLVGFLGQAILLSGSAAVDGRSLNIHFSILCALLTLVGSQAIVFGVFARTYSKSVGLDKESALSDWVEKDFSLERGLIVGALFFFVGLGIDIWIFADWINRSMGALDAVRPALYALTLMVLGMQFLFAAFFLTIFQVRVHGHLTPASRSPFAE